MVDATEDGRTWSRGARVDADGRGTAAESYDPGTVLAALDDEKCRRILRAVTTERLTAPELADRCDLSSSTVYRKLDRLVDAGLLEQSVRVGSDTKPADEYRCAVDRVEFDVDEDDVELVRS